MASERGLFIVADGMGGHAAGEVASEMATQIIAERFAPVRGMSDDEIMAQMVGAIRAANDAIFRRTLTEHDKRGMGTTTTVLSLLPRRYLIGHVGDSRAYMLRGGVLSQLTKDHSLRAGAGRRRPADPRRGAGASLRQRDHPLRRVEQRRRSGPVRRHARSRRPAAAGVRRPDRDAGRRRPARRDDERSRSGRESRQPDRRAPITVAGWTTSPPCWSASRKWRRPPAKYRPCGADPAASARPTAATPECLPAAAVRR